MKMDERKQKVLHAIILDYIATAGPVGSRTLVRKYDLGVSPATVRNEMADLEEMGLIEQPHTSAGRIPSQYGYRYYIDCLMKKEPLNREMQKMIKSSVLHKMRETKELIANASRFLSQLTNYTALSLTTFYGENSTLQHIQFFPVEDGKAVLVIVLDNGHVEHRQIDVPTNLNPEDFNAVSKILSESLRGLPLSSWRRQQMQDIYKELDYQRKFINEVIDLIEQSLKLESEHKFSYEGTLNILNQPEFKDIIKVRELLKLFEEEKIMREMLHPLGEKGVSVKIGTENNYEGLNDCSLITATYKLDGKIIGTLGLLGPTRMEYSKVYSILEYLTDALSDMLDR